MSHGDWRPWTAGAIAGSAQCVLGHPFDTAKVRMQASSTMYRSTLHCIRQTVRTEGALALYKGLPPALLTACTTSGLRFGVQHHFNRYIARYFAASRSASAPRTDSSDTPVLSFVELPAATRVLAEGGGGAACGMVLPLVYTPMELIKCRRQVMLDNRVTTLQIAREVLRTEGLAGLYVGHRLTVVRSTVGNATLFGSFEAWRVLLSHVSGISSHYAGVLMLSGVLSGWSTQLVTFPVDAAKSRAQVAATGGQPLGMVGGLAELWKEGAMYRGLSATLLRAVPVHIAYLPMFGVVMGALGGTGARCEGDRSVSRLLPRLSSQKETV
jgi:hypothetical protein